MRFYKLPAKRFEFSIQTSKTTFYNDQPHFNIKKLKNSEILEISEKIQRDEKLSEYFKMFDKSLKLTLLLLK